MVANPRKARRIFLADDDKDDCSFFEDALNEVISDCNLTTAYDGKELMNVLDATVPPPPDMIFLDLNMPRKNGFECLKEIRMSPKLKDIPVVVFTTAADKESINKVYSMGANRYICKPGSYPVLKKLIDSVLKIDANTLRAIPQRENFVVSL